MSAGADISPQVWRFEVTPCPNKQAVAWKSLDVLESQQCCQGKKNPGCYDALVWFALSSKVICAGGYWCESTIRPQIQVCVMARFSSTWLGFRTTPRFKVWLLLSVLYVGTFLIRNIFLLRNNCGFVSHQWNALLGGSGCVDDSWHMKCLISAFLSITPPLSSRSYPPALRSVSRERVLTDREPVVSSRTVFCHVCSSMSFSSFSPFHKAHAGDKMIPLRSRTLTVPLHSFALQQTSCSPGPLLCFQYNKFKFPSILHLDSTQSFHTLLCYIEFPSMCTESLM